MIIPNNVSLSDVDIERLNAIHGEEKVAHNLARYAEWKEDKDIYDDKRCFEKFILKDTTSTPSVNRNAPQPIPQKRNKGKLSFYLTKGTEGWWLMEKDGDSEIECYVDFGVAFDNAVNQLTWTGQHIPIESVFVNPDFLPLFKELWQEYDETGELPEELTKNKFWVWAKDPNSPILKPNNKAKTKRFDWETL